MPVRFIFLFFLFFATIPSFPQNSFDFNSNCKEAYKHILAYNLPAANKLISLERKLNPENLVPDYLANGVDAVTLLVTGNARLADSLLDYSDNRINKVKKSGQEDPLYFLCLGDMYIHRALVHAKFGDFLKAGLDINRGYKTLREGSEKYPAFLPLKKYIIPINAFVGTLPSHYKIIASVLGFKGDVKASMEAYSSFCDEIRGEIFHLETDIIYSYLLFYLEKNEEGAWNMMEQATRDFNTNQVSAFLRSHMALTLNKNEIALEALAITEKKKDLIPHIYLSKSVALIRTLNPDAKKYAAKYIRHYKGEEYIKDAYLTISFSYLLEGNLEMAEKAALLVHEKGKSIHPADKHAEKEVHNYSLENISLLKARLLYDGGYLDRALGVMNTMDPSTLGEKDLAEYLYRLGRIYQDKGRIEQALAKYELLFTGKSREQSEYYIPASVYQSGVIWEEKGDHPKARTFYEKVLEYRGYSYEESFEQKAKAGLERIK